MILTNFNKAINEYLRLLRQNKKFKGILLKKTCWDNQLSKQIYSENY